MAVLKSFKKREWQKGDNQNRKNPSRTRVFASMEFIGGIFERDGGTCIYCGNPAMEVDHVIPPSWGGKTLSNNLVCACRYCNRKKRNHIEDYLTRGIFYLMQVGEDTRWIDKINIPRR